ncbi:hypothetical protein F5146DRAFT_1136678 [Armillaria mellea]|nr:hypothetical protein F5146DRAFT_1136678 [Armillaria mellea]
MIYSTSGSDKPFRTASQKPRLILNPNFRGQHFGIAEGYPWCYTYPDGVSHDDCYKNNIFPMFSTVRAIFQVGRASMSWKNKPTGQSRDAYILTSERKTDFISLWQAMPYASELVHTLLSYDSKSSKNESSTGLMNTAWTRAVISLVSTPKTADSNNLLLPPISVNVTRINKEDHLTVETDDGVDDETKVEALAFFGGSHTS